MTLILFFLDNTSAQGYTMLAQPVDTLAAAVVAGVAYTTEPNFAGSTILTDDNFTTFDPAHTYEVLTLANAQA